MTKRETREAMVGIFFIWIMGLIAGYNVGIKSQADLSIPVSAYTLEHEIHGHQ